MNRAYCSKCNEEVIYLISERPTVKLMRGRKYTFTEKFALCSVCDTEIHIPALIEENTIEHNKEFREINGIIEPEKIEEIMQKYNITKSSLGLILGWGGNTFARYSNGDIPSRQYSDILWQIYYDPDCYIRHLEMRKSLIPLKAYRISLDAALELKKSYTEKIDEVAEYLLRECGDITVHTLQILIYYARALYRLFYGKPLFPDDCEAWEYGIVYPRMYRKYKEYNVAEHRHHSMFGNFTYEELEIMDVVAKVFGCYSGKILGEMVKNEEPWLKTRRTIKYNSASSSVVEKRLIAEYFDGIKVKYDLRRPADISRYVVEMISKITQT